MARRMPCAPGWPSAGPARQSRSKAPVCAYQGIGASEDIVSAVRLIMDGAGLRSITVLDPPIEDVILSVYQHGVE